MSFPGQYVPNYDDFEETILEHADGVSEHEGTTDGGSVLLVSVDKKPSTSHNLTDASKRSIRKQARTMWQSTVSELRSSLAGDFSKAVKNAQSSPKHMSTLQVDSNGRPRVWEVGKGTIRGEPTVTLDNVQPPSRSGSPNRDTPDVED